MDEEVEGMFLSSQSSISASVSFSAGILVKVRELYGEVESRIIIEDMNDVASFSRFVRCFSGPFVSYS